MAVEHTAEQPYLFDDALYCDEEGEHPWGSEAADSEEGSEAADSEEESVITSSTKRGLGSSHGSAVLFPLFLLEQDLFWDDEELRTLFRKEQEICLETTAGLAGLSLARKGAVEWILRINAHYGFSALTAILAANYLDRFLDTLSFHLDRPWMMQLAAVTCLSLAAKVEETHVPLLLDLQVEGAEYVFEAKTIQRMELLVLSSLKWRVNPVTPLCFIDHIIRRLGLNCCVYTEFLRRCENLLLSVISDPRAILHLPSVLATATMLHVIHQVEPCNAVEYENHLLGILKISKEQVNTCYEALSDISSNTWVGNQNNPLKRSLRPIPISPTALTEAIYSPDSSSCTSSPKLKRRRVEEEGLKLRVLVGRTELALIKTLP